MRRTAGVVVVAMLLSTVIVASPAGATAGTSCATVSGTTTFSPPLPMHGDPTMVVPTATATGSLGGCVGGGVTSGTLVFSATASNPTNCDSHVDDPYTGTETITWNTAQTTTFSVTVHGVSGGVGVEGLVTAGLFVGSTVTAAVAVQHPAAECTTTTLSTQTFTQISPAVVTPPTTDSCTGAQTCTPTAAAAATVTAPGLAVAASGKPASGTGTVQLAIVAGVLKCPKLAATVAPVADLTDTGFSATDRINVTATLPLASATSAEQVCFSSAIPFRSQTSPNTKKSGTAFLLSCSKVANEAPCVVSSQQIGTSFVVKLVVPGGDPRFYIVLPKGRQVWLSHFAAGKVGNAFAAQLQTSGGIAPIRWSVASGKLPKGCSLNAKTGAISGRPSAKGAYPIVVLATDSEQPAKSAQMNVPITVQ